MNAWFATFHKTNSSPLKHVGWDTILSFWEGLFQRAILVLERVFHGILQNKAINTSFLNPTVPETHLETTNPSPPKK